MAQGRYSRIDGQNSSNHCLIICMVGFVSTCVLGAWMSTSSSSSPIGTGISVEQFMGGMPKVVTEDDPSVDIQKAKSKDENPAEAGKELSPQGVNESSGADEIKEADESTSNDASHQVVPKDGNEGSPQVAPQDGNDASPQVAPKDGNDASPQVAPEKEIEARIQDDQTEKYGEVKKEGSIGDSSDTLSGSESSEPAPKPRDIAWPTQSSESEKEKLSGRNSGWKHQKDYRWKVCNVTAGPDYIPCLDNLEAIKRLKSTRHYEHRERHCPDEAPTCLVPLPKGYRTPVKWPKSRDMIWFVNVPHTKLAGYKGKQNWVKAYDRYLTFPGGGTQFVHGALHYIDYIQETEPDIDWGKRSRVVLDVGCGVASFGGYLFDRDVITMSLAPKDEHEAQVQFALERGIPAFSAVMGTKRLPFPSMVFDIVHCARCRVPWHVEGGKLLLELNRVLRPGGFFVWSATPVYRKDAENTGIWKEMSRLTKAMCWELVKVNRDVVNRKSAAIFRKTTSNDCYERRTENNPPLCEETDDPNEAWYTPLQQCIHKVPRDSSERGFQWPATWPSRLEEPPYWLKDSSVGVSAMAFTDDSDYWKQMINNLYLHGIGMDWSTVRNVMDMNASYGGFAAALKDLKLWVMNVVPVNSSNTLPIIYERGLFGMYHDWCESFSTYPRSYDVLHADNLFFDLMKRCNFVSVMAEIDRILRPGGRLIVRDNAETLSEVKSMAKSIHWKITLHSDNEGILCIMKTLWRPTEVETITGAIGNPRR